MYSNRTRRYGREFAIVKMSCVMQEGGGGEEGRFLGWWGFVIARQISMIM